MSDEERREYRRELYKLKSSKKSQANPDKSVSTLTNKSNITRKDAKCLDLQKKQIENEHDLGIEQASKKRKYRLKKKTESEADYNRKRANERKKERTKKKAENEKEFKRGRADEKQKGRTKKKTENEKEFNTGRASEKQKERTKKN